MPNSNEALIKQLVQLPDEMPWLEFKHNNADPQMIGEDISALANAATLHDRECAYMVWGVDNDTHEILGTTVRLTELKKGNQEIENWLRCLLSKNADFQFQSADIDGNHVEFIIIHKAVNEPVAFEKTDYIRIGTYTKKLQDFNAVRANLWDKQRQTQFEEIAALTDLSLSDALQKLHWTAYFDLLQLPQPTEAQAIAHPLLQDGIIRLQDNALYSITNLGALLFAKNLNDFPRLGRKALRVVLYKGVNRLTISKEPASAQGYAVEFENIMRFIEAAVPSAEDTNKLQLSIQHAFPFPTVREAIANAMVHQDLHLTGVGPVVEIFDNRIEVTNPGAPLVDINRIIDNPPKSRNEKLASLMRRLKMCEELGRGWDRMVIATEMQHIPAPHINIFEDSTKVTVFSHIAYTNLSAEDKIWSCYLHACVRYVQGDALSNSSLRERFGLPETSSGSISRLIKEAAEKQLIKPLDPATAPRYMKYIPVWA